MRAKALLLFVTLFLCTVLASGQESTRDLDGPGHFDKLLTPNQFDRWLFDGEKGETILVHVTSTQFDPVLELTHTTTTKEEKPLLEVDDPGSESRFTVRLPEDGKYEIRVHAFKYQGGGNYSLSVERFKATPLVVGEPLLGTFDRTGKSHHYFEMKKDQILVPDLKGASSEAWKMFDAKGREMKVWSGTVHVEEPGEAHLVVSGQADSNYSLLMREARQRDLANDKGVDGTLQDGEVDVWNFQGKAGDFAFIEIEKTGEVRSRLIYAPLEKSSEQQRLQRPGERPEIKPLPAASRGGRVRYAAILGREGRYQLQLVGETAATYKLITRDPSVPIAWGDKAEGSLSVGGSAFFSFEAAPGQLLQANLGSKKFVPVLRLFDAHGQELSRSDDNTDALEGRITLMVEKKGMYRLQVASLGDGGGGEFDLALTESKLNELKLDGRGQGTVQPSTIDFWSFASKEGQTVILSVRSSVFEPVVSVRSPDGVLLSADKQGSAATGVLLALKLPSAGKYTVSISSSHGAGGYQVRLIDGD